MDRWKWRSYSLVRFEPKIHLAYFTMSLLCPCSSPPPVCLTGAWHPEYGSWMVEATPGAPYGGDTGCLRQVEVNMAYRRARITAAAQRVAQAHLAAAAGVPNDDSSLLPSGLRLRVLPFSTVSYPLMGVGRAFTSPPAQAGGPFSASAYLPDSVISPHPRFGTLTANIRHRRGRKVEIQVPLFEDARTNMAGVTSLGPDAYPEGADASSGSSSGSGAAAPGVGQGWHAGRTGGCGCGPSPLSRQADVTTSAVMSPVAEVDNEGDTTPVAGGAGSSSSTPLPADVIASYDARSTIASARFDRVMASQQAIQQQQQQQQLLLQQAVSKQRRASAFDSSGADGSSNSNSVSDSNSANAVPLRIQAASAAAVAAAASAASSGSAEHPSPLPIHSAGSSPAASPSSDGGGAGFPVPPPSTPGTPGSSKLAYSDVGPAHVPLPGSIHMDAMGFGMGCCCLQVTFQARDIGESRQLYDQLTVVAPLMMALTANAPIWRGRLADTDTRWGVIAASVDCRTPQERGPAATSDVSSSSSSSSSGATSSSEALPSWMRLPSAGDAAGAGRVPIPKSRYSSVDCFIDARPDVSAAADGSGLNRYNDVPVVLDGEAYATLRSAGIDPALATHIAHLFVRDPLVIFRDRVTSVDDSRSTEHFENVQSTNWQSVRWKPPPPDSPGIGWRVELRTMEAQVTDYENAAFTVFVVLLTRVMLFFGLNLYVPLSAVEANFGRASARGAATEQKFYFRRHVWSNRCRGGAPNAASASASDPAAAASSGCCDCDAYDELSLAEIFLGPAAAAAAAAAAASVKTRSSSSESVSSSSSPAGGAAATTSSAAPPCASCSGSLSFPGLIPLIYAYLDIIRCDVTTRAAVDGYIRLVAGRATGAVMTGATWQRAFVTSHPCYRQDSVVGPAIVYDLLTTIAALAEGKETSACNKATAEAVKSAAVALLGPQPPAPITFHADPATGQLLPVAMTSSPSGVPSRTSSESGDGLGPLPTMTPPVSSSSAPSATGTAPACCGGGDPSSVPLASSLEQLPVGQLIDGLAQAAAAAAPQAALQLSLQLSNHLHNSPVSASRGGSIDSSTSGSVLPASAAAPDAAAIRSVRLRGGSFFEELKPHTCKSLLLKTLAERYALPTDLTPLAAAQAELPPPVPATGGTATSAQQ